MYFVLMWQGRRNYGICNLPFLAILACYHDKRVLFIFFLTSINFFISTLSLCGVDFLTMAIVSF